MIDMTLETLAFEWDAEEIEGAFMVTCPEFRIERLFEFEIARSESCEPLLTIYKDDEVFLMSEVEPAAVKQRLKDRPEKMLMFAICLDFVQASLRKRRFPLHSSMDNCYGMSLVGACM